MTHLFSDEIKNHITMANKKENKTKYTCICFLVQVDPRANMTFDLLALNWGD